MSSAAFHRGFFEQEPQFPESAYERLRPITQKAPAHALSIFGGSHLSSEPVLYGFRSMRALLKNVVACDLELSTKKRYERWLNKPAQSAFEQGLRAHGLSQNEQDALVEQGDPSMFAIYALESVRFRDYPELHREHGRMLTIVRTYDLLCRSIHDPAPMAPSLDFRKAS